MKKTPLIFCAIALFAFAHAFTGCASSPKHTEQMLSEAGFRKISATTDKQRQHLKSLPTDKLTVAKVNGKTVYVFADPAHNQIYVGNLEAYQTYKQILTYSKLDEQNRAYAEEGLDSGDNTDEWVEWTNTAGWAYGSN